MKKLKVNADNCIGCGLCVNMAPDAFALNDEGKSEAIAADPALSALAAQSDYAVTQLIIGDFWTPATAFGNALIADPTVDVAPLLDQWVAQTIGQ